MTVLTDTGHLSPPETPDRVAVDIHVLLSTVS